MAGQIIVSSIKTDSDNSISFVSNTGATIFSANLASGLSADSFGDNTITSDKIVSVANTKIAGNIVSSQITSVANTQLTGTVTSAQVGETVYEGMGMRNRIINGDMRIDQRNAGASINNSTSGVYSVDRWKTYGAASAKFSIQQNAGSVTPPAGFVNYLGVTSLAATTPGSSDQYDVYQLIEGYNIADLNWGSANAKTVTLSFWVRSSLTGTFGGVLKNTSANRSYPFTYTISSANTWEYKTVTVAGDTTGTWESTTSTGINLLFSMGGGSSLLGTAGAWAGANYVGATGQTNIIATNGATWYITGVQLEVGSVATPFERRPYGTELALCQRYYQQYGRTGARSDRFIGVLTGTTGVFSSKFIVPLRASPTITYYGTNSSTGTFTIDHNNGTANNPNVSGISATSSNEYAFSYNVGSLTSGAASLWTDIGTNSGQLGFTVSAEL